MILECHNLKTHFPIYSGVFRKKVGAVKAVDDISFSVPEGGTVAIVGESGSGKSTAALSAIRLIEPTEGTTHFLGNDLGALPPKKLLALRRSAQVVFQDPYSSLNPRKTILDNVGDALTYHKLVDNPEQKRQRVAEMLKSVGLNPDALKKHPHEFSGGQLQRISIARGLIVHPKLLILDEAVSALDLSVQASILNLLFDLKEKFHLSYLFISHDLGVVQHFCDYVLVMYRGKIVERGATHALFQNPTHSYTQQLLDSILKGHPRESKNSPHRNYTV